MSRDQAGTWSSAPCSVEVGRAPISLPGLWRWSPVASWTSHSCLWYRRQNEVGSRMGLDGRLIHLLHFPVSAGPSKELSFCPTPAVAKQHESALHLPTARCRWDPGGKLSSHWSWETRGSGSRCPTFAGRVTSGVEPRIYWFKMLSEIQMGWTQMVRNPWQDV